ncbi:MAG: UDP-N-acetylmuramoyl-tripeptide--D-alanyl-D-alanine ligase [Bacteroidetes bacterium]|nr:UDP-N-acetylmuramoyl-tripeptide--D-alanyl-D-alanine ligase [Bacteroidota bacterium]
MTIAELYELYAKGHEVQTDTRKLKNGDIYFALKGENFNGNCFAQEALKKGAAYAVVDEIEFVYNEKCILVNNVLETLQQLAIHHRKQLLIPFIAITGSNGKTTTKELLHAVLSTTYKTYATKGNLNNHIGIPLTLLQIKDDAEIAIIEMGANHLHEIESYCKMALPTHALITNCGKAHLEGFGSEEAVKKGKGELYDYIRMHQGTIYRNTDLAYLSNMSSGISKQVTYGAQVADFVGKPLLQHNKLLVAITTPHFECSIQSQLVGEYNFANIMAAFAVGSSFGVQIDKIKQAIEMYAPDNSRSQLITQESNFFIMDAYNANPSSMQAAITNFVATDYPNKIVMLGGMKELGAESITEHQKIISQLEQTNWNQVILVGGDFAFTHHSYLYFDNITDAAAWYNQQTFKNTAFLIKGSRAIAMEKILQPNQQK